MFTTWRRISFPFIKSLTVLLCTAFLLITGKWVRTVILHDTGIRYYPKHLDDSDADLAIVMDSEDRKLFNTGEFTLSEYKKSRKETDAGPGRDISNWATLTRLSNQLESKSESDLPKKPIDYWKIDVWSQFGQGLIDRIDDFPFVNTVATIGFGLCLACSVRRPREHEIDPVILTKLSLKERLESVVVGVLIWLVIQAGHFFGDDFGPLHGTLRTEAFRTSIQMTQWADSALYLSMSLVCGYYVVIYWRLLRIATGDPTRALKSEFLQWVQLSINAGLLPLLLIVVAGIGFLTSTQFVQFLPVSIKGYAFTAALYLLVILPAIRAVFRLPSAVNWKPIWYGVELSLRVQPPVEK